MRRLDPTLQCHVGREGGYVLGRRAPATPAHTPHCKEGEQLKSLSENVEKNLCHPGGGSMAARQRPNGSLATGHGPYGART